MTAVRWTGWNGQGLAHCLCIEDADGLVLEGVVAGNRHGTYGGHYTVRTDAEFRTREVKVDYIGGPNLHVVSDGLGNWRDMLGRGPLLDLDGCIDVDIGMTPATNTLPIKRMKLGVLESRGITAAYVPLPAQIEGDFLPQRADQRYTCLIPDQRYRYEGLFRAFTAELEIDAAGLVLDYPETFRRVALTD